MSHEVLLAELRRKSSRRIADIRRRAELEAETLRSAKELEFDGIRKALLLRIEEQGQEVAESVVRGAEKKGLLKLDAGRRQMVDRLVLLALQQLGQVRHNDYERMFAELIAELPDVAWERVRVNPLDAERARAGFPGAEVVKDESITGGFEVEADNGQFRVVSTLKQRLLKAWPYVLPMLLREVEEESNAHRTG